MVGKEKAIKARLQVMMFLQFFAWGAWYHFAGNYLRALGMDDQIYLVYMACPVGSIVAPFFIGMVADRFFSVQRVLGVLHLLSGLCIGLSPLLAEGPMAAPGLFMTLIWLNMLLYMPTLGLATATAFHNLSDPDRDFPITRAVGTVGYIAAGILVSFVLKGDGTAIPMYVAGAGGVLLGIYSFTLPNVPPPAKGAKVRFADIIGLDALRQLKSRAFYVFIISLFLISIPVATWAMHVPLFLADAGFDNPGFRMTFGNMSEVLFLLMLPWFFRRWGVKTVVMVGLLCWAARFMLFALGAGDAVWWMIMIGIVLHGACYDFVYISGQIYLDKLAPVTIRSQAQGLFVLTSYGIGQGGGTLISSWLQEKIVNLPGTESLAQWQTYWFIPAVFSLCTVVIFFFGSRDTQRR